MPENNTVYFNNKIMKNTEEKIHDFLNQFNLTNLEENIYIPPKKKKWGFRLFPRFKEGEPLTDLKISTIYAQRRT
jgi:hypothetical protein